jgi:hypothetical protein
MYTCLWTVSFTEFTVLAPNLKELANRAGITMTDTIRLCVDALDYTFSGDVVDRMLSEALYLRIYQHYDDYPHHITIPSEDKEAYVRACDLTVRHLQRLMPYQGRPTEISLDRTILGQAIYMLVHYDNR